MDRLKKSLLTRFPADRQIATVGIYYEKLQVLERWFVMPETDRLVREG